MGVASTFTAVDMCTTLPAVVAVPLPVAGCAHTKRRTTANDGLLATDAELARLDVGVSQVSSPPLG